MNKHPLLIAVAATALLAGVNIASAQSSGAGSAGAGSTGAGSAPAQKSPDAGSKAGGAKDMQRPETPRAGGAPKSGTTGEAPGERADPKAKDTKKSGTSGRASEERSEPKGKDTKKSGTTGRASEERSEPKGKDTKKSGTSGQAPGERADPKAKDTKSGTDQKAPAQKSTQPSGTRTDATASISVEQRSRIRETVLKESNAPRVDRVDFRVSVGTVVPRSVRVVALPARVVEIHPAWRGFLYFIVGDEIVVVEPGSLRIVAVLPA